MIKWSSLNKGSDLQLQIFLSLSPIAIFLPHTEQWVPLWQCSWLTMHRQWKDDTRNPGRTFYSWKPLLATNLQAPEMCTTFIDGRRSTLHNPSNSQGTEPSPEHIVVRGKKGIGIEPRLWICAAVAPSLLMTGYRVSGNKPSTALLQQSHKYLDNVILFAAIKQQFFFELVNRNHLYSVSDYILASFFLYNLFQFAPICSWPIGLTPVLGGEKKRKRKKEKSGS